ncbi:serine phosphatase RsbU (regulator of sigma subunit) [Nocardioides sp. J9]|uniref:PP2C family protein-serine/threonine phosphatase n=1 Tax=Nocardioides sp. J9 TaxID=935844 RepID=UPI0011A4A14E|nr:PP2C family protein-serine/threonine phosphatase [Nocardioides sp. J9]TWG92494.1 serine phosphatase RsbU (regulator of sigma subunit) [Nocardioides sp. J9]
MHTGHRSALRARVKPAQGSDHGLTIGFAILVILLAADLVTGVVLTASYASAVIVTALITTPQRTAVVAAVTLPLSLSSGFWHDSFGTRDWVVRCILAALLSAGALVASQVSTRREERLQQMTRIADVVQRALLRAIPPELDNIAIATRYQSATQAAAIGGDLYEAVSTDHGVRILVGDVRGKGIEAAETAATVLGAFKHAASRAPDLATLAATLDRAVSLVIDEEDFVTALLVEVDGAELRVASCGHHPPLHITDGTGTDLDTGEPSPPLGFAVEPETRSHPFPAGSRVLLYTDGLIEARNDSGDFFDLDAAHQVLAAGTPDDALDAIVQRVTAHAGHWLEDDIALVLIENLGDSRAAARA